MLVDNNYKKKDKDNNYIKKGSQLKKKVFKKNY